MRLVDEVGIDLDGLSQLRALIASGRKAGILEALDFDFIEVEDGRAVFAGTPGDHAYNPIGSVHGGYAATLLDSACGCAAHSRLTASQAFTTLELKVAYHKRIWVHIIELQIEDWGIGGHTDWLRDYESALNVLGTAPLSAIQLQDRFETAFEDSVLHAVFFVFAATKFAFHLHVRALLQGRREVGQLAERNAAVPFGTGFPRAL